MKMAIMRIGRAELRVLDLEESVNYYTNIIGLEVVGRSREESILRLGMNLIIIALSCKRQIHRVSIILLLKYRMK